MTPHEATDLAQHITSAFLRCAPSTAEWAEELTRLDIGRATTAFVRCRRTVEHLTLKHYLDEYKALTTTDAGNRPDPCPHCDGTGYIVIEGRLAHRADLYGDHNGRECHCHVAAPCRHCQGAAA